MRPDGTTVVSDYAPSFPAQYDDISYGIGLTGEQTSDLAVAGQRWMLRGTLAQGFEIGFHHRGEQCRANATVRGVKHATKGTGKAMHRAQTGIRQCQTATQTSKGHLLAGRGVAAISHRFL